MLIELQYGLNCKHWFKHSHPYVYKWLNEANKKYGKYTKRWVRQLFRELRDGNIRWFADYYRFRSNPIKNESMIQKKLPENVECSSYQNLKWNDVMSGFFAAFQKSKHDKCKYRYICIRGSWYDFETTIQDIGEDIKDLIKIINSEDDHHIILGKIMKLVRFRRMQYMLSRMKDCEILEGFQ